MPETPPVRRILRHEFKPPRPKGGCAGCNCPLELCQGVLTIEGKGGSLTYCPECAPVIGPAEEAS